MADRLRLAGTLGALASCSTLLGEGLSGGRPPSSDGNVELHDASVPPSDAEPQDAGGATVRGVSQTAGELSKVVLRRPDEVRPDDVLWVVLSSRYDTRVQAPAGFEAVDNEYWAECTISGWRFAAFVHHATATEPNDYTFDYGDLIWASGVLLVFDGLSFTSNLIQTSAVARVSKNPYAAPLPAGGAQPTYAVSTYVSSAGAGAIFTTPSGVTPLVALNGTAVYGRRLEAAETFASPSLTVAPDECGFVHVALLNLR